MKWTFMIFYLSIPFWIIKSLWFVIIIISITLTILRPTNIIIWCSKIIMFTTWSIIILISLMLIMIKCLFLRLFKIICSITRIICIVFTFSTTFIWIIKFWMVLIILIIVYSKSTVFFSLLRNIIIIIFIFNSWSIFCKHLTLFQSRRSSMNIVARYLS